MSRGLVIELRLTKRLADAILRSKGLSNGHGIRRSAELQEADMRLRHAIINALAADQREKP